MSSGLVVCMEAWSPCVVSDDHTVLYKAIERYYQGCLWRCCQAHFLRNIISQVNKKDRPRVIKMVREVTAAQSYENARERMD